MSSEDRESLKSVLIIDDDEANLELYSHFLKEKMTAKIISVKYPTQALNLALENFFDFILVDVTINYQGSPFGGFDIYKSLFGRYGDSSLIAYSQYVTDDLLKQYNYNFNFIEKLDNPLKFIEKIVKTCNLLRKKQKCFVAMPFEKKYDEIFKVIKKCVEDNFYKCIRLDQVNFNRSIVQKIFQEIRNSKLVIFLANDRNPNVFYECGYAMALNKEIVTITDFHENLPFDIRDMNSLAYGEELNLLETSLQKKLSNLTITDAISTI